MSSPREIEAKFEADDATLTRMLALERFGDFMLSEREDAVQDDTYYDTAAGLLRRAGSTLRIRRRASGARMTFKGKRQAAGDAHVVSRLEDEVDLEASSIAGLDNDSPLEIDVDPGPLTRARSLSDDHPLVPTARLMTHRTTLLFDDRSGTQVEVSVDRCTATRLADGRVVEFSEVELELKAGDSDDLLGAAQALKTTVSGLRPSLETKLKRALE